MRESGGRNNLKTGSTARLQTFFAPVGPGGTSVQLLRYFFVGGAAALVDWSFYWGLIRLAGFHYLIAAAVSFTAATLVNYGLSVAWVFVSGSRFSRLAEIGLVFLVSAVGLAINQLCLALLVEIFSVHFMAAKIIATGVVFFWNFLARKYYVFKT